jgi:hypothetical protein
MTPRREHRERVPRRYVESPRTVRTAQWSRSKSRRPLQSTGALTAKMALLAVIATLAIGGLIAAQMAAGSDPSLGPKAAARASKASTSKAASASGGSSSASGYTTDPYAQTYGGDGYNGSSSGYSSGSSGGYSYAPPPVTSSTS